jgi:hypothetical protein
MPSRTRRQLLAGLGATGVTLLTGCTDGSTSPVAPGQGETATTRTRSSPAREWARQATPSGPVRGEGPPVSVERAVTDKRGYTDDIEYFHENGTVRYVAGTSGGVPIAYDTMTFNRWGELETASAAADRAQGVAVDHLGAAEDAVSALTGVPPDGAPTDLVVTTLRVATLENRDGEVIHTPSVTLPDLVEATPRAVDATVSLDGDSYSRTVPVYAEYAVYQQS